MNSLNHTPFIMPGIPAGYLLDSSAQVCGDVGF